MIISFAPSPKSLFQIRLHFPTLKLISQPILATTHKLTTSHFFPLIKELAIWTKINVPVVKTDII